MLRWSESTPTACHSGLPGAVWTRRLYMTRESHNHFRLQRLSAQTITHLSVTSHRPHQRSHRPQPRPCHQQQYQPPPLPFADLPSPKTNLKRRRPVTATLTPAPMRPVLFPSCYDSYCASPRAIRPSRCARPSAYQQR